MPVTALPLENRRIIVTRPEEQAGEIAEEIRRLGGIPVTLPMIDRFDSAPLTLSPLIRSHFP